MEAIIVTFILRKIIVLGHTKLYSNNIAQLK